MLRSWLGGVTYRRVVTATLRRTARRETGESQLDAFTRRARQWLVRHGDPDVMMAVGDSRIMMPLSHELPLYRAHFPTYDRTLPLVARALAVDGATIAMIDVGANVGDTVALVLEQVPGATFLCVEGHPRYAALLRRNLALLHAAAEVAEVYCDDGSAAKHRLEDDSHGTARLAPTAVAADAVPTSTLDNISREFRRNRTVHLLKIDTDGWDMRVLRGAADLLREAHPVVFVEFHPALLRAGGDDPVSLVTILVTAGYRKALMYSNRGVALGTHELSATFAAEAESRIDGTTVEYLDLLAWAPSHDEVMTRFLAVEAECDANDAGARP